ncbi:hypothetical protein HYFRA_00008088 [Hymenoscyphus fraxineus]|uniref:Glycosyltransferase family 92 protein n=1 Tax=Hymenoscyphus fraxineus TaxID=746836 RepID=A0A9N9PQA7_9HELO|nr:hypothetical protein HYFRA_00008088 [Hymenoscyphus fraxineus]
MLAVFRRDGIPWGLVLVVFSTLILFHFVIEEFGPWTKDLVQTQHLESSGMRPSDSWSNRFSTVNTHDAEHQGRNPAMYPKQTDDEYVAVCMSVRDQYLDLKEVVIHHFHHLGIRRFYFMDDGSEPPLSTYEDWGIPKEHITFNYYSRDQHIPIMQEMLYNKCIEDYRHDHTWMGFLDADEMLEMTAEESLVELLKRLEKDRTIGALAVSWMTHTSNGLLHRPESARKAFTDCIHDDGNKTHNYNVKAIGKTEFHNGTDGVHQIHLKGGTKTVDEHGKEITLPGRNPTRDRIALHHYAVKSREEYEQKISRSNGMDTPKGWKFWDEVHEQGGVPCPSMAFYDP